MNFLSVMYQTSRSKGQELLAQRMVKWVRRLGHNAWVVTGIYHDGKPVVSQRTIARQERGYIVFEKDPAVDVPSIRVDSLRTTWPPRRIMFRDFITTLRNIDSDVGIDFLVTHSTLWNGPEEAAKWVLWRRLMISMGEEGGSVTYAHMSHYQPPDPGRYSPIERAFRMAWNATAFPAIFRAADLILCLTSVEAEDMLTLGARPDQMHLFPGGLDDDTAALIDSADPMLVRSKYGIPDDKYVVSYLGTIEERKNPLAVAQVARKLSTLKDVVFVIAGKPGDQWEDLLREIRGLSNVVLTGELDEEIKASLIRTSYLNIIMSRMEAFGLTQLEFMYGGVPVITSAVYGQRWLVRNNVDGVHVGGPEDVDGASKAIEELVRNPDKREEMSKKARDRAKSFLMSTLAKELLDKASQQYKKR
ncbi:MAG: glycosyltransferase family 4 protein [Zestosphaera sp.]